VTTWIRTARTASCLKASTSSRPDCNRLRALFRYDHDPLFGRIICRNGRAVQRGFQREACGITLARASSGPMRAVRQDGGWGWFSGWGFVWTCRSCRSAHYTMQNPTMAPGRPRAGAVSFAWPTSSAANIHGYSLAYFNLLDACAKQRAAAHGQ
jgi:hypothetical protein